MSFFFSFFLQESSFLFLLPLFSFYDSEGSSSSRFISLPSSNTASLWLPLLVLLTFKHFIVANYVKYHILDLCLVFGLSVRLSNQGNVFCALSSSFSWSLLSVSFLYFVHPQGCSSNGCSVGIYFLFIACCLYDVCGLFCLIIMLKTLVIVGVFFLPLWSCGFSGGFVEKFRFR